MLPLLTPTGAVAAAWVVDTGDVEEDVDTSMFPTVDSGCPASRLAPTSRNWSGVTTSRYAHAGTAVAELILFGYLVLCHQFLLRQHGSNRRRTWILRPLLLCNLSATKTI